MTQYIGLDPSTGLTLTDTTQLAASLRTLLTTPIGSRLMRRDYGSRIPDLIDAPLNPATLLRLTAAAYIALRRWEPRLSITRITFESSPTTPGRLVAQLTATRTDTPTARAPTLLEIAL